MPVGHVIRATRQRRGLTQKDLASRILKEDGQPISPPYLHDIERDRRNAPSVHLLAQFAAALDLSTEYLYFLAGVYPPDIAPRAATPEGVEAAWQAFRAALT